MVQKKLVSLFFFASFLCFSQKSDFKNIDFTKADKIAKTTKSKRLYALNNLTLQLTKNLKTDVEKVRAIYKWICLNVASDFKLFAKNNRKRKKYKNDSLKLATWNSELKRELFAKLLKRKKTICTGYAYLFKEMCSVVDIECKMVYGFGKTVDFLEFDPNFPNHTWNAVKLNNKWYLCDATWAAGTSYPEENRFLFNYNDGYFFTAPKLFFFNHFPVEKKFSLLGEETPTFQEFIEAPLLYSDAYQIVKEHVAPQKMNQVITKGKPFLFQYKFKKNVDVSQLKLILSKGEIEKHVTPIISSENEITTLKYTFLKTGSYDVHLYYKDKIIATYVFQIDKQKM